MPVRGNGARTRQQGHREALSQALQAISDALSVLPVDLQRVLQAIVDQARGIAGARYAALGIVADPNRPFEPWVFSGISEEEVRAIGHFPRPMGLLGAVPQEGETIRLADLRQDPRSRGFPPHHPDMHSFLGVPIRYRGKSVGNLYLGEKVGADAFSEDDQWAVELLAAHVAMALQVAGIDELRTSRERALEETQRRVAELDCTITSIADGVAIFDATGKAVRINPGAERILGRGQEITALSVSKWIELERVETAEGRSFAPEESPILKALKGETVRGVVMVIHPPDGGARWVSSSAAPLLDYEGKLLGAVATFTDITDLRELQEQRTKYILGISHGLRTPLTVVQGQAELLLQALSAEGAESLVYRSTEAVVLAAQRMSLMLRDLVDLTELEIGHRLMLNQVSVDLPRFVSEVCERLAGHLDCRRLEVEAPRKLPEVSADADRLERILVNLLSNALKYSLPVTPVKVATAQRDGGVEVSISNRARPIRPDVMATLFEPYRRARLMERPAESLGLGLYVTKGLVEAHGGRIWAESSGDQVTFRFTLPLAEAMAKAA